MFSFIAIFMLLALFALAITATAKVLINLSCSFVSTDKNHKGSFSNDSFGTEFGYCNAHTTQNAALPRFSIPGEWFVTDADQSPPLDDCKTLVVNISFTLESEQFSNYK
jgi:hypothetical protein